MQYTPQIQQQVRDLLGIPTTVYVLDIKLDGRGATVRTLAKDPITGEHFRTIAGIPGQATYFIPTKKPEDTDGEG